MALSTGVSVACTDRNRRGGLKRLWLLERNLISSFATGSDHEYSSVTLDDTSTDTFYLFEFDKFSGGGGSEGSKENGSDAQAIELTFNIPKLEKVKAAELNALKQTCDVVAIFEDHNGKFWVAGWDETLDDTGGLMATVNEEFGTDIQDANQYALTLSGQMVDLMREFTGDTTNSDKFEQP